MRGRSSRPSNAAEPERREVREIEPAETTLAGSAAHLCAFVSALEVLSCVTTIALADASAHVTWSQCTTGAVSVAPLNSVATTTPTHQVSNQTAYPSLNWKSAPTNHFAVSEAATTSIPM